MVHATQAVYMIRVVESILIKRRERADREKIISIYREELRRLTK